MTTADIRSDVKSNQSNAYERKMARQRPQIPSQDTLDRVVREQTSYFRSLSLDKHPAS